MRISELNEIYGKILELKCVEGCTKCCGDPAEVIKEDTCLSPPLLVQDRSRKH
jgi:hypothetical protein